MKDKHDSDLMSVGDDADVADNCLDVWFRLPGTNNLTSGHKTSLSISTISEEVGPVGGSVQVGGLRTSETWHSRWIIG